MKNYKKTVSVVTTTTTKYELLKGVYYVIVDINGIEHKNKFETTLRNNENNIISICYDIDVERLKKENPFMTNNRIWNEIMKGENALPSLEDIDLNKIYYCDYSNQIIYDVNWKRIHYPHKIDYISSRITNENFNLVELREYLKNHPNILEVSDILKIPYYNATDSCNKYLEITILPNDSFYDETKGYLPKNSLYYNLQNSSWTNYDPLNIKQYMINE